MFWVKLDKSPKEDKRIDFGLVIVLFSNVNVVGFDGKKLILMLEDVILFNIFPNNNIKPKPSFIISFFSLPRWSLRSRLNPIKEIMSQIRRE